MKIYFQFLNHKVEQGPETVQEEYSDLIDLLKK